MITLDTIGLFLLLAGFVIGLGAVTVIDVHGFLGRKSSYWTEATIRTHKVTKPLIWFGMILAIIGGVIVYSTAPVSSILLYHLCLSMVLLVNGLFLSFYVSPLLLRQEKEGRQTALLPKALQQKIFVSFLVSDSGWWGGLLLLVYYLSTR